MLAYQWSIFINRKVNGAVPWQIMKWSKERVEEFKFTDPKFVLPAVSQPVLPASQEEKLLIEF